MTLPLVGERDGREQLCKRTNERQKNIYTPNIYIGILQYIIILVKCILRIYSTGRLCEGVEAWIYQGAEVDRIQYLL